MVQLVLRHRYFLTFATHQRRRRLWGAALSAKELFASFRRGVAGVRQSSVLSDGMTTIRRRWFGDALHEAAAR
jgi:hypothetical protein